MIVFVHLFNDRSGSPRVLCSAIAALRQEQDRSRLFIGSDGSGCLNEVGIEIMRYWYRRTPYRPLTLATYLISQLALIIRLFCMRDISRDALIYVNTLLPFGAAIYGWLSGRPVVYHLHEVSLTPAPLKWFLMAIARRTARCLIYVSDFHHGRLPIEGVPAAIVHNSIDDDFLKRARDSVYLHRYKGEFNVLMLASLRDYKGVPEFLDLANRLRNRPDIRFNLVVNDDELAIMSYFHDTDMPPNMSVHPRTEDPGAHYAKASLVLNLSRPDLWVETFGLTLLEAMAYGIPVIAPPIGGPAEVVRHEQDGFLVDSRNRNELAARVLHLADDAGLCLRFSAAARSRASVFSQAAFTQKLRQVISKINAERPVS